MSDQPDSGEVELSVVVPLYNEQDNVDELYRRLNHVLTTLDMTHEVIFVDDGSDDVTFAKLEALAIGDLSVVILKLSRNFGHQAALTAGIDAARGEALIVMDGDLQDPPEVLPQFVARWREGFDVVYAIRTNRKEIWPMRLAYYVFYRMLRTISDLEIPLDSGDFCLMDRQVVNALKSLPERMRFVRGLRTFVGFRQTGLAYERAARSAGKPKYTLRSLFALATDGLVSFSSYPLRLVTYLGLAILVCTGGLMVWALADGIYRRTGPPGWASLAVIVLFLGAVQLICMGIIGEYVRLIFLETKGRPTYVIQTRRDRTPPKPPDAA